MNMILIADIFGFCGMMCFLFATIKQWHKIRTTHHSTAISLTSYRSRIIAGMFTLGCFGLTGLWLSFTVVSVELAIAFSIMFMLLKYRRMKK